MKSNCWDITQCGRELGGKRAAEAGVCATSTNVFFDGTNGGSNAGRCCWRVSGTLFRGDGQCELLAKVGSCQNCHVFTMVKQEEGMSLRL